MKNRFFAVAAGVLLPLWVSATEAATLIHEFDFNNGTANDSSGSLIGALFGDASISGGLLHLDGDGDYVELDGYAIPRDGSEYSVLVRAQQLGRTADAYMELISQGISQSGGFYIGHDPLGIIRLGDTFFSTGVAFPNDGAFHNYLLTSSAVTGTSLFIDGVLLFTDVNPVEVSAAGTSTRFGRQFAPFQEFFTGKIDYVGVYSGIAPGSTVPPNPSVIPLPASLVLLPFGFGLLFGLRRLGGLQT